jgi:Holliday junction resolvase
MTHTSKRKGNAYERELVNQAIAAGLTSKRAYASNGLSLGHGARR